ncbi:MAG: Bax inhibitor-1 family protein [Sphingomonas sp.]
MVGLFVALIVNMFLQSSMFDLVLSVIGVLVFAGLAAFQTQQIKLIYDQVAGTEMQEKVAVMGAFRLYVTFVNLFLFLLPAVRRLAQLGANPAPAKASGPAETPGRLRLGNQTERLAIRIVSVEQRFFLRSAIRWTSILRSRIRKPRRASRAPRSPPTPAPTNRSPSGSSVIPLARRRGSIAGSTSRWTPAIRRHRPSRCIRIRPCPRARATTRTSKRDSGGASISRAAYRAAARAVRLAVELDSAK